jgi:hypothetical protein
LTSRKNICEENATRVSLVKYRAIAITSLNNSPRLPQGFVPLRSIDLINGVAKDSKCYTQNIPDGKLKNEHEEFFRGLRPDATFGDGYNRRID